MSKFLIAEYCDLAPYVPGEQPKEKKYIKLNTNESPFPPSEKATAFASEASKNLQLYSDPECKILVDEYCKRYNLNKNQVLFTNGSDEILNFAFMAFCDNKKGAVFADITYGFYKVFANINKIPFTEIPLKEDFTIDVNDYKNLNKTIFIANPNAPTGIYLTLNQIEEVLSANKDSVVVIDEAYIDFGGESAVKLIDKYDNLLVTQTFSKSRSMAGARLGVGIANEKLIEDLNKIKYSINPYNVNAMTMMAGYGSIMDDEYFKSNCQTIIENREFLISELEKLGFISLNSMANFIFCKNSKISGKKLYESLREYGILVRYFDKERISDFVRITIGNKQELQVLINTIIKILGE